MNNHQFVSSSEEITSILSTLTNKPIYVFYYDSKDSKKRTMLNFFESQSSRKTMAYFIMADILKLNENSEDNYVPNTLECYFNGKLINKIVSDDRNVIIELIKDIEIKTNTVSNIKPVNQMNSMIQPQMFNQMNQSQPFNPMVQPQMFNQMNQPQMFNQMNQSQNFNQTISDEEITYPEIWVQYFVKTAWGSFPLTKPEKCEQTINLPKEIPPSLTNVFTPTHNHNSFMNNQDHHSSSPSQPPLINGQTYTIIGERKDKDGKSIKIVQLEDGTKKTVRFTNV